MIIHSAAFVKSSPSLKDCPASTKPEFGFIGRSNVGKSSLINMLTGWSKLAKTSVQPGKTRTINHFIINDKWYLVDLPGYGYAKVPIKLREKWTRATENYILMRDNLVCLFVLLDTRLKPQQSDLSFMEFLGIYVAFSLVKILVIWLISVTFKNKETAKEYIQNILIYNLVTGILLLPLLLLIIYTYHEMFLYLAGGLVLIMIFLRFIRGIAIGLSDSKFSLIHLFLYLCTLEILPLLVAAKFLSKYFFS